MRVGEAFKNNSCSYEIIEWHSYTNCTILFNNGYMRTGVAYNSLSSGNLKTPYCPTVFNIGYIGEGSYNTKTHKHIYIKWKSMLCRCYYKKYLIEKPTYKDCTVAEIWHNFQNFAQWYEENYDPKLMQDWELDKDMLVKGNKTYSPETCCFVPRKLNMIVNKNRLPLLYGRKYKAICGNTYLGLFSTEKEAKKVISEKRENIIYSIIFDNFHIIDERVIKKLYDKKLNQLKNNR